MLARRTPLSRGLFAATQLTVARHVSSKPTKHSLATASMDREERKPTDQELLQALAAGVLPEYKLESHVNDAMRAANVRRQHVGMGYLSGIAHPFLFSPYASLAFFSICIRLSFSLYV